SLSHTQRHPPPPPLFPYTTLFRSDLTAAENLRIACTLAGHRVSPRRIQQALDSFELADLPVKRLSQGQRRRAVLARLVVSDSLPDRKSTRLNSSHVSISYAVFCLK